MNKLIGMTDFVLDQEKEFNYGAVGWKEYTNNTINYANFLKQSLELWMFVPCKLVDGVWVVLEEPEYTKKSTSSGEYYDHDEEYLEEYQQAKEKCLFEGFEAKKIKDFYLVFLGDKEIWVSWNDSKIIEDLIKYKPLLTKTARKQLSL